MGRKINLIVNYRNSLRLYHLAVEQMTVTARNYFIKPADFARFVAESYMTKDCDHVICVEFLGDKITKAGLKSLAECDAKFLTDSIKKSLGQRWEFAKEQKGDDKDNGTDKEKS